MGVKIGQADPGICPSREELVAFKDGRLPDSDWDRVEKHVDALCPQCLALLEEIGQQPDPLIDKFQEKSPLTPEEFDEGALSVGDPMRPAEGVAGTTVSFSPSENRTEQATAFAQIRRPVLIALLRKRLLFAAILVSGLYAVFLFKLLVFYEAYRFDEFTSQRWGTLFIVHGTLFAMLVIAAWFLWSGTRISLLRLRLVEGVIIGLPILNQLWIEAHRLVGDLSVLRYTESIIAPVSTGRTHVLPWFAIIIAYGVLIPNTWRRCTAVVLTIAAGALAVNVLLVAWDGVLFQAVTMHHLLEIALWLTFASAFSIYTCYRVREWDDQTVGQYRIVRILGWGGMGVVYLAEHMLLNRLCALKMIRPDKEITGKLLDRFEGEVKMTAKLTHPNTIEILEYGRDQDGTLYYSMEYVRGLNLHQLVKRFGPLPVARVVHLLRQVCDALAEAHAADYTHRDIKPGNIMVCDAVGRYDTVKLFDFGLAGNHGRTIGFTSSYMSPEQAPGSDKIITDKSDQYSLGATAYFLLTGTPPFLRDSVEEVIEAHRYAKPVSPNKRCPGADVPPDLEKIVLRCLEKEPDDRFQSVSELEEVLANCECAGQWSQADSEAWWRQHRPRQLSGDEAI